MHRSSVQHVRALRMVKFLRRRARIMRAAFMGIPWLRSQA